MIFGSLLFSREGIHNLEIGKCHIVGFFFFFSHLRSGTPRFHCFYLFWASLHNFCSILQWWVSTLIFFYYIFICKKCLFLFIKTPVSIQAPDTCFPFRRKVVRKDERKDVENEAEKEGNCIEWLYIWVCDKNKNKKLKLS